MTKTLCDVCQSSAGKGSGYHIEVKKPLTDEIVQTYDLCYECGNNLKNVASKRRTP